MEVRIGIANHDELVAGTAETGVEPIGLATVDGVPNHLERGSP